MGGVKQQYLESIDKKYYSNDERFICNKHFSDNDLLSYFDYYGSSENKCSFCDNNDKLSLKLPWTKLMDIIISSISNYYDDPANVLGYNSGEGGYLGVTYSTDELINDIIGIDADYDIIEEIIDSISQDLWTETDFYGGTLIDRLIYNWQIFENLVKYKVRYVFNELEQKNNLDDSYKPVLILNDIGEFIKKLNLVVSIPEKSNLFNQEISIYRARQHKTNIQVKHCSEIGPAPKEHAAANRFSAEGISIFYGSQDEKTAIKEVVDPSKKDEVISIGKFKPARALNLVDLRNLNPIGFFNINRYKLREPSLFLISFVKKISKKINRQDNERIDYVPSQIVTEYFRFVLPKAIDNEINGVIYKSIQDPQKDCYAIFADSTQCSEEDNINEKTLLVFEKLSIVQKKIVDINRIHSAQ